MRWGCERVRIQDHQQQPHEQFQPQRILAPDEGPTTCRSRYRHRSQRLIFFLLLQGYCFFIRVQVLRTMREMGFRALVRTAHIGCSWWVEWYVDILDKLVESVGKIECTGFGKWKSDALGAIGM